MKQRGHLLLLLIWTVYSYGLRDYAAAPPKPTQSVLEWTKLEVGAFFSFNMITEIWSVENTQLFCIGVGGAIEYLPPADYFYPDLIDLDNWLQTAVAFGAKYAVLTSQHCSGFAMWPTDVFDETGFQYNYSTRFSPLRGGSYDVVQAFVDSCKKYNVLPGIYYSLNQNFYLDVGHGRILNTSKLLPGQVRVSQELYNKIVLAQLRELWTRYGDLTELWFDGGCIPGLEEEIAQLTEELQPNAVYHAGCSKQGNTRWVGTESGDPEYPVWTNDVLLSNGECTAGQGKPEGTVFCPAESDTVLQTPHQWFYRPYFGYRSLADMKNVYLRTVGQNSNLLLNVAANSSGLVPSEAADIYKSIGDWVESCFGEPVNRTSGVGDYFLIHLPEPTHITKVMLREDQTNGAMVTKFLIFVNTEEGEEIEFSKGQSIGNKYILDLGSPILVRSVSVLITESYDTPVITDFSVYKCPE